MSYTLHTGDCLDILPTLEKDSANLIVTDPPYYRVKSEWWDRQWDSPAGYLAWLDKVLAEFERVLAPNGSLYLFASPQMAARVEVLMGERFNVLNRITWRKPPYSTKAEMFKKDWMRSFFPASEAIIFAEHYGADNMAKGEAGYQAECDRLRGFVFEPLRAYLASERDRAGVTSRQVDAYLGNYMSGHYFGASQWALPTEENYHKMRQCFHDLNHQGEYLTREYEDLRREYEDLRREYEDGRRPFNASPDAPYTDVWDFQTVAAGPKKHPCEKPLDLLEHIIATSSRDGDTVLDAFMGSGATGEAAINTGRNFVGIEISERWAKRAGYRLANAINRPRQLSLLEALL